MSRHRAYDSSSYAWTKTLRGTTSRRTADTRRCSATAPRSRGTALRRRRIQKAVALQRLAVYRDRPQSAYGASSSRYCRPARRDTEGRSATAPQPPRVQAAMGARRLIVALQENASAGYSSPSWYAVPLHADTERRRATALQYRGMALSPRDTTRCRGMVARRALHDEPVDASCEMRDAPFI